MSGQRLVVVSHQRWRAEELAPFADVRADLGLDTAAAEPGVPLWCPGAWAAAAVQRHSHLQLSSAGPRWLDCLPIELTGREVLTTTVGRLIAAPPALRCEKLFAKLPETKHDRFQARVRGISELIGDLAGLPEDEPVQVQTPVRFDSEVRCWVRHGEVVARASYFPDTDRTQWSDFDDPARASAAVEWLEGVLPKVAAPAAVVIDVGWCSDPASGAAGWRIVEANAPWSSDWYVPTDMAAVLDTIIGSQVGVSDRWRWSPSPLLLNSSRGLARR